MERVRYAYSDWPVLSLRNKVGGLLAHVFDAEVAQWPKDNGNGLVAQTCDGRRDVVALETFEWT